LKISTVQQMQQLDKTAIEMYTIKNEILMENAGRAAFTVLKDHFQIKRRHFVIVCGIGNNGGDGLVVARHIHSAGGFCSIVFLDDPEKFKGAAKYHYGIARKLDLFMKQIDNEDEFEDILYNGHVVVDALFGTGLSRNVEGLYADIIGSINMLGLPVLSLDIPSGINGNTGQFMGNAIEADLTVTFGLPKLGNLLYPGFECGGEHYVSHISFPPELHETNDITVELNLPGRLKKRWESGHKGYFGDVLFIAGAAGYLGAPYFAARSFLKAGGGYSRLATPASIIPALGSRGSEIVFLPQKETSSGSIAQENFAALLEIANERRAVVIGPGLSLNPETQNLICDLVGSIERPLVIDGDGLTAICNKRDIVKDRNVQIILTPHIAEMARLTGISITDIENDKVNILRETAESWNSTIILKGPHSLIGLPDGQVFINLSGNSGLATAGSGDVLAGVLAAMLAHPFSHADAVQTAVFLHGFAGDLCAEEIGEDGMTARDIMNYLPKAMRLYRDDYDDIFLNNYGKMEVV